MVILKHKHMDVAQIIRIFAKTVMWMDCVHSHLTTVFVKRLLQNGRSITLS